MQLTGEAEDDHLLLRFSTRTGEIVEGSPGARSQEVNTQRIG